MKEDFNPIDLNLKEFNKIFKACIPTENTKRVKKIILQQQSDGFPNDSKIVYFDAEKTNEYKNEIFYLYGQLMAVHEKKPLIFVADFIKKYDGTVWTQNESAILFLLHLGMACGASSKMNPPLRSIFLSTNLIPTLSPTDPNFSKWYEQNKEKFISKSDGQEPGDE